MSETSIVRGKIEIMGQTHGAMNALVTIFGDEENWQFKQFVSQEQLDAFAAQESLVITVVKEE